MRISWPDNLDATGFLLEYWQKKPLLIRQAFPDFENPLSPDELGGLAMDEEIHSRLILRESEKVWHLRNGPFSEEELTSLPPSDWTLLVSDIEKHLDGFRSWLSPFNFIPDWRVDDLMISYAPTGASAGPHTDQYDVFLFQAGGAREWSISTDISGLALLPDLDMQILDTFDPTDTWVLEPGDMLYLPPGIAHHGVSRDDDCMTWSIGFRAPSWSELTADIANQLAQRLDDAKRYEDPRLEAQSHSGEISAVAIQTMRQIWDEVTAVSPEMFNELTGCVLTQRSDLFPIDNTQSEDGMSDLLEALSNAVLVRDPATRTGFIRQNEGALCFVDGKSYSVSCQFAEYVCGEYEYSCEVLKLFADNGVDQACLLDLWRRNILGCEGL